MSKNIHFDDENAVEEFYSFLEYNMGKVTEICDEYTERPDINEEESSRVSKLLEEYNNSRDELSRQNSELNREIIYGSEAQPFYETNPTLYKYLRDNGFDLTGMCNFEGVKSILMQYGQYLGISDEELKVEEPEEVKSEVKKDEINLEKNETEEIINEREGEEREFSEAQARQFFKTFNDYTNVPMATPIKKKWKEIIAEKIKELAHKGKDVIDNMFR